MNIHLLIGSDAQRVLRHLHPTTKKRMRAALKELKETWPTPHSLDVKQLRANPSELPIYRMRVGPWRAVFRSKKNRLELIRVFHRRDGYDWLER